MVSLLQPGFGLSHRERQVLQYLASHAGGYIPTREIAEYVYGREDDWPNIRYITRRLRLKGVSIEHADSFGYRLRESTALALARFCTNCGRDVITAGRDWACYGCGASGTLPYEQQQYVQTVPGKVRVNCYTCSSEIERSQRKIDYEVQRALRTRGVEPRVFCSLDCSRRWRRRE